MLFSTLASIAAFAGLAVAGPITPAPLGDKPDLNQVYVESISYAGTGCPAGSVSTVLSDDRTIFTLIMDSYVASIGPGILVTENRKNCQLNIKLHYPGGWQYSIFQATYRGYAGLDKGVQGIQKATYYFSGQPGQCSTQSVFDGPVSKDYEYTDTVAQSSTVWSPCGAQGMLNINSQVRLTSRDTKASGQLTTDSIDGNFKQIMSMQWQKCK